MKYSLIIVISLIIITILSVIFTYLYQKTNWVKSQSTVITPFSGTYPDTELVNSKNEPQITCPNGFGVNIIGAWKDSVDVSAFVGEQCNGKETCVISLGDNVADKYGPEITNNKTPSLHGIYTCISK